MDDAIVLPTRHRLNMDDFYRMAEAGILGENERVELIDGDLIDMAPTGQGHSGIVSRLTRDLVLAGDGRAIVWSQSSIRLDRYNVPQPDLAILRYRADFYATGEPPGPADVLLLIEVADSSLAFDRKVKLPLYARFGIAEVWIVDVQNGVLDAHRAPLGDCYTETSTHQRGDQLALVLAPDIVVRLELLFGERR
jgi:Uma2 family endonuclease